MTFTSSAAGTITFMADIGSGDLDIADRGPMYPTTDCLPGFDGTRSDNCTNFVNGNTECIKSRDEISEVLTSWPKKENMTTMMTRVVEEAAAITSTD
jgi:hypothetical protein